MDLAPEMIPLVQWNPEIDGSRAVLDEKRCHVRVVVVHDRHQCPNGATATRPMHIGSGSAEIVTKPVCGTHKRMHDDAQARIENAAVIESRRAAIESRFKAAVKGTTLEATAELVYPVNPDDARVTLSLTVLEALLEVHRPVDKLAVGDIVAFIVRDGARVRYQGTGRVKYVDGTDFVVTDSTSGRRYKVPRDDVKRSKPRGQGWRP